MDKPTSVHHGGPDAPALPAIAADPAARSACLQTIAESLPDLSDPAAAGFLAGVAANAPFLAQLIRLYPDDALAFCERGANPVLDELMAGLSQLAAEAGPATMAEAALKSALRVAKGRAHLLVALADIAGHQPVEATTAQLSELADLSLKVAVNWLLRDLHRAGKIVLADPVAADPGAGSGLVILGMGKLGARELNYSSDIDLIVFFDPRPARLVHPDPMESGETFSKMVRRLIAIMQDRTGDGYVFRTDLRLRPDPGAMPLAIPVDAGLTYYEGRGQNWERAAMIKARPVAGDLAAGDAFLRELVPYVWRKYLDYAAIADVQSIKRQIHAHKGHGRIAIEGHNIKLGRGGIREIEFFVQTQQLIAGGRAPQLRHRATLVMLDRLAAEGWIESAVRDDMAAAYRFLRRCEHGVQMIADEQTHTLPETPGALFAVAALLGFGDLAAFRDTLRGHLQNVERHFGNLFREGETLAAAGGNLSFTGEDPDPGTLATLSQLGFQRAGDMWNIIRTWHFGRYSAVQSARARERLTELTPALLESFAATGQPDEALLRFDAFLKSLPAGIQLFAMLHSNRQLLSLLMTILSAAPRLADIITHRPLVFDGMLDPAFFSGLPDKADLADSLAGFMGDARLHEDRLDRLRIFAAEQRFLVGVRFLTGAASAREFGHALSDIADLVIAEALQSAVGEVARRHGRLPEGRCCLVALGRLGSREMTAGSDVDMILLYDHPADAGDSDGEKPIAPSQYFIRLTQRLIAAVSAPTSEGVLYEVDFRLRPSGNKGPLATSLGAFRRYQREEAWTWEHMALTRARPIAGDPDFMAQVEAELAGVIAVERDIAKVRADIASMRERLMRDKPPAGDWDLKRMAGGMTDIDFIAQFFRLTALRNLNLPGASARSILELLEDDMMSKADRASLVSAHDDYAATGHLLRLCTSDHFDPATAPKGLVERLCGLFNLPSADQVRLRLTDHRERVSEIFRTVIGDHQPDA